VKGRGTLYLLLTVVAGAAAMLSFAALRDLALLCGFTSALAWLLPVVVDAGAASGSLVWLGPATGTAARVFARRLALGLLGLSVAANALGHGLAAYALGCQSPQCRALGRRPDHTHGGRGGGERRRPSTQLGFRRRHQGNPSRPQRMCRRTIH
jgi:hypothetical protein